VAEKFLATSHQPHILQSTAIPAGTHRVRLTISRDQPGPLLFNALQHQLTTTTIIIDPPRSTISLYHQLSALLPFSHSFY
jgi:hypothetical protein